MFKKLYLSFSLVVLSVAIADKMAYPALQPAPVQEEPAAEPEREVIISEYDHIIRNVSLAENHDWRFISAIAYHESRFRPDAVSSRGARGLMQIMPVVARQFKVEETEIMDPQTNVRLAAMLLNDIDRTLRIPSQVEEQQRMKIILAAYNAGVGHVSDARRLAVKHGEDCNDWSVVAHYLELKSQPEYYRDEVVRSGRFTGIEQTSAFVEQVVGRYAKYCLLASR